MRSSSRRFRITRTFVDGIYHPAMRRACFEGSHVPSSNCALTATRECLYQFQAPTTAFSNPLRFLTVGCERCHGPGAVHVEQRRQEAPFDGSIDFSIVNPR